MFCILLKKCEIDHPSQSTVVNLGKKQTWCSLWCPWSQVQQDTSGPDNFRILGCLWTIHHRCTCKWDWTEILNVSFPLRATTVWNLLRMNTERCRREAGHKIWSLFCLISVRNKHVCILLKKIKMWKMSCLSGFAFCIEIFVIYDLVIPSKLCESFLFLWPALYRPFLKHCTLTNKAVGTIWRDLSKPTGLLQQSYLSPLPDWRLSYSVFTIKLVYFLYIIFITYDVCVSILWPLRSWCGCWSVVYIRRVINDFLKMYVLLNTWLLRGMLARKPVNHTSWVGCVGLQSMCNRIFDGVLCCHFALLTCLLE